VTRIRIRKASRPALVCAWVLLAFLALGLVLHHTLPQIARFALDRPANCSLKTLAGFACVGCRGTRAAFAFANGNLLQAFLFNPLVATLGFCLATWALLVALTRKNLQLRLSGPAVRLFWIAAAAFAVGSWIFVICAERTAYNPGPCPWPMK
jgi:hypothetical protein